MRRAALALALAATAGCAHSSAEPLAADVERPVGEDLIDLLPAGPDVLVDVDVGQLESWPTAKQLLALLPAAGRARLQQLGDDPLSRIDAVVVGVYGAGTPAAEAAIVARGALDWQRLRQGAPEVDYHGARVVDRPGGDAIGRVTQTVLAFGSPTLVRRVLDVAARSDESVRRGALDARLRVAFARAPTAKLGRPALMLAVVATPPLREALRKAEWASAAELDWLALSFAIGDGFDVGIVGGTKGEAEAQTLAGTMKARAGQLESQPTLRLLGLQPYVDPFVVVSKNAEVHVAYRLAGARVDQLLTRLAEMQSLGQNGETKHEQQ